MELPCLGPNGGDRKNRVQRMAKGLVVPRFLRYSGPVSQVPLRVISAWRFRGVRSHGPEPSASFAERPWPADAPAIRAVWELLLTLPGPSPPWGTFLCCGVTGASRVPQRMTAPSLLRSTPRCKGPSEDGSKTRWALVPCLQEGSRGRIGAACPPVRGPQDSREPTRGPLLGGG